MLSTRDFETLFQHIQKEKKSNFVFVLKKQVTEFLQTKREVQ